MAAIESLEYSINQVFGDQQLVRQEIANIEDLLDTAAPLVRIQWLHTIAFWHHLFLREEEARPYFAQAIEALKSVKNYPEASELYADYAGYLINQGQLHEAVDYLDLARAHAKSEIALVHVACRDGALKIALSDISGAAEMLYEADKKLQPLPVTPKLSFLAALVQSGLGEIYAWQEEMNQSALYHLKALKICENQHLDARLPWMYLQVGNSCIRLHQYKEALAWFNKVIQGPHTTQTDAAATAYANMGFMAMDKKQYELALNYFDQSEAQYLKHKHSNYRNLALLQKWRGIVYLDNPTEPNTDKAIKAFKKGLWLADNAQDLEEIKDINRHLAHVYKQLNKYKEAYNYMATVADVEQEYAEHLHQRKLMELKINYETEKKKDEVTLLTMQLNHLQAKAFRAQMNPHFIFNALSAISVFIGNGDKEEAKRYLAKVAQLLRRSLIFSDAEHIALEEEIDFLTQYLLVNKELRFKDQLSYQIHCAPELLDDDIRVPAMIVQPYIENAIEHGIREIEKGTITVTFAPMDDHTLKCTIEDNGVGLHYTSQKKQQQYQAHKSKGTSITLQRLQILLPNQDKETLVTMEDLSIAGHQGTRVEVLIPIR